jgi:DNA-binding CsgD family transcriptional regulator
MPRSFDPIAVIEAGYRLHTDAQSWLDGVTEACAAGFPRDYPLVSHVSGMKPVAHDGTLAPARADPLDIVIAVHASEESLVRAFEVTVERHDAAALQATLGVLSSSPWFTHSEWVPQIPAWRGLMRDAGVRGGIAMEDAVGLFASSGQDTFMVIAGSLRTETSTKPRERRAWKPISLHLGAALRLRERLGLMPRVEGNPYRCPSAEAILEPSGKLLDARSVATDRSARRALREAVVGMERARRRAEVESPEHALSLWQDLVAGRWSLLERFDTDGRRLLVAYRNDIDAPDPRALGPREKELLGLLSRGLSNKEITEHLGIAPATVSFHLKGAARKLGMRSTVELASMASSLERADGYALLDSALPAPDGAPSPSDALAETDDAVLHVLSTPRGVRRAAECDLTEAERAVVHLVGQGLRRDEVARRRGAALQTVHNQLASAYRKLGITSSRELFVERDGV